MLLQDYEGKIDSIQEATIRQYLAVLRRHVVKDDDNLVREARDLYEKHQRAFDFIFENKPSYATALHSHLERFISEHEHLRLDDRDPHYFKFVPLKWDQIPDLRTKKGWHNGSLISCELKTPDSPDRWLELRVVLYTERSGADQKLGRAIYESIEKRKAPSGKYLFAGRKKLPVPSDSNDDFKNDVERDIASYVEDDLPRITAEIRKAVASVRG
jgi:hypothetical protein